MRTVRGSQGVTVTPVTYSLESRLIVTFSGADAVETVTDAHVGNAAGDTSFSMPPIVVTIAHERTHSRRLPSKFAPPSSVNR
jgi:hypothetical protein